LAISKLDFFNILQQTRREVFTIEIIESAWRAAYCWPIDCRHLDHYQDKSSSILSAAAAVSSSTVSDTPARLCHLSQQVEDIICLELTDDDNRAIVHELINFAVEKVTKYRDIAPHANTLSKLHSGKVRKKKKRTRHIGIAQVLRENHINKELRRLAEAQAESVRRQRAVEEKKRIAQERKATKKTLDKQWRIDLQRYQEVDILAWQHQQEKIGIQTLH